MFLLCYFGRDDPVYVHKNDYSLVSPFLFWIYKIQKRGNDNVSVLYERFRTCSLINVVFRRTNGLLSFKTNGELSAGLFL